MKISPLQVEMNSNSNLIGISFFFQLRQAAAG